MNAANATLATGIQTIPGYAGKLLRVDLTKKESTTDILESDFLRKYIGGG